MNYSSYIVDELGNIVISTDGLSDNTIDAILKQYPEYYIAYIETDEAYATI